MGAASGGQTQRLPSGGLAGQGGQVGQRTDPRASMTKGPMNIARPLTQNPYQQAAGAQQQALATTGAATQYQTSPTAMGRMAAGMAYQPPSAATGTMTAGTQYQAPTAAMGALSRGTSYEVNPLAQQGFQRAMGYNPQQVAATSYGAAQEATPMTAASAMQGYQNPYETQVVQQTLRDIGSQAQLGQQNLAAQAQAAKAFGGSRHGIAEEAMKGYTQQMADAAGRLRQQGFQTQLGAGQFDVGQQSASTARNIAAENVARQFGAQTGMTAQQLNQAAGLSGAQLNLAGTQALSGADLAAAQERRASANALAQQALAAQQARMGAASQLAGTAAQAEQLGLGAAGQVAGAQRADVGTRTGAASQLANLGQQSFGYGTAIQGQQQRAGEMDRAIMQNLIGAGQQSFGQYTGAPTTGLQTLIGALTGVPQGQSQSFQPGLFNYAQLGAQMYGGM